jgi:hypothetical protein
MGERCHLCDQERELRESHVIPSFIIKWLKDTSGGGLLRFGENPNKRVQDGYKYYWMCDECEGRLNKWETEFANKIFYPLNSGEVKEVIYDSYLLKFCVSISWRVLNFFLKEKNISHFPDNFKKSAENAFNVWKNFLLDKQAHPEDYEQHFLLMDGIKNFTGSGMPTNINRYILRVIDFDAVCGRNSAFIYSKLQRFIVLGFIEMPFARKWSGTKIHVKHGRVGPEKYEIPALFINYFMEQARKMAELQSSLSENQNKKTEDTFRKNIDIIPNSETFKAMSYDVKLFGEDAFKKFDKG